MASFDLSDFLGCFPFATLLCTSEMCSDIFSCFCVTYQFNLLQERGGLFLSLSVTVVFILSTLT